ncbi:hypothetical protein [Flavobacterium lacus]|uniref:Uncharacterized protein n=1 Tax=Flavobacterium lacus TaxID=1353778 RepID=A0A328WRA9_9FLAO|nr:hypothetical protein [Flavobacterium lacus]RAR47825.1 hypothetical protein B0I10_107102 [Flavobacterium lacus]
MEPNNIEKQIKEKLNQREIQPSQNAWDRLDAMLSVEEQKPKRSYKWLSIAAIFMGFTLIGIFMINQSNSVENTTPTKEIVFENEIKNVENQNEIENNFSTRVTNEDVVTVIQAKKNPKENPIVINPKKDFLLDNHSNKKEAIVENQSKKSTNKYTTAESLLAEIETGEKMEVPNISKKPSVKVDANALLSSAEKEVDESFRDKVIQSINKKYNSVKSTLANRNYE